MKSYFLKALVLVFFILSVCTNVAFSQLPYFSQFYADRVNLNPAYAGFDEGYSVTLNYRDQWFGIPDGDLGSFGQSYRTFQATGELQLPCFIPVKNMNMGLAVLAFHDRAGGSPMITQGFGTAFSFELADLAFGGLLDRLDLRAGFQIGLQQKSVDSKSLIYSSQLDPVLGFTGSPEVMPLSSGLYPTLNAGFMFRGFKKLGKDQLLITVGLSLSNVNTPQESLLNLASAFEIPMGYTFHMGFSYAHQPMQGVAPKVSFAPQFRWQNQFGLELYTFGGFIQSKAHYVGLFYQTPGQSSSTADITPPYFPAQNTRALIINIGTDLKTAFDSRRSRHQKDQGIILGLSYDINLGGLQATNTLGVLELNLRMNFPGKSKNQSCGSFSRFETYKGKCPVKF